MDYSIALENRMNSNKPLNGCEINVRFCIKAGMYQDLFQFIGYIRNVCIGRFFNVQCSDALFEFFFVMLNQQLDLWGLTLASLSCLLTIKIDVFPLLQVFILTGTVSGDVNRTSCTKLFHSCVLSGD